MLGTNQSAADSNPKGFVPGDAAKMAAMREKAMNAPRATHDQKTALIGPDDKELPLISLGKVTRRDGKVEQFFYTRTKNAHGYFVTFVEVTGKDGAHMKDYSGRRVRNKAKALCENRKYAAELKASKDA